MEGETYLEPLAISAVDGLDQLRVIQIKSVGPNTDNGPVLLVEVMDDFMVFAGACLVESPPVGEACKEGARVLVQRAGSPRDDVPSKDGQNGDDNKGKER